MNGDGSTERPINYLLVVGAYVLIVSAIGLFARSQGFAFLQPNPYYFVADTVRSLWELGSLERAGNAEVYPLQLEKSRLDPGKTYWQDIFSLGRNGELILIRGVLMSFVAVPFYALFGDFGFWLMSQLQLFLVLFAVFRIARRLSSPRTALLLCGLLLVGSPLLRYSYQFSYDVFATALVLCGLDLLRTRPLLGSVLMSAAVETRFNYALFLPFLLPAWLPCYEDRKRALAGIVAGAALAGAAMLALNYRLWGHPLTTGYQRILGFKDGAAVLRQVASGMGLGVFASEWGKKLFGSDDGLLRYNPILALFPFGLVLARANRLASFYYAVAGAVLAQVILVYSLSVWSHHGNASRYLLPAIVLAALCGTPALHAWRESIQKRARGASAA
jgi:hypothetical protein